MISPSAPAATAARDTGATSSRFPVPWLGSTITGRWVRIFSSGTALMSIVLRVYGSKVRIPRSHRMTRSFPWERMYSAAMSSSSIVDIIPRFSRTGRCASPTACRSA